jgi:peptidoglycan/LPS O-acetylase OafA/YrhL
MILRFLRGTLITLAAAFLAVVVGYLLCFLSGPGFNQDAATGVLIFTFICTAASTGFALAFRRRPDDVLALTRRITISLAFTGLAVWLAYTVISPMRAKIGPDLGLAILLAAVLCAAGISSAVLARRSAPSTRPDSPQRR